jgi:hypothetical protein
MTALAMAVGVLMVLGWPMVWLATRSVALSLLLAPLAAALGCSAAAMAATATRTPLLPWVALVVVVGTFVSWRWPPPVADLPLRPGHLAVIALMVLPLLVLYRLAPGAWDARSIWWFHAEWYRAGGSRAAAAFANPAFGFSHADYPPLGPSTIATTWSVFGNGPDARVAQAVTIVVTYSALVTLGVTLTWVVRARTSSLRWIAVIVAGLLALGAGGLWPSGVADGFVDNLWSAWFVAAAVLLLLHPPARSATTLATVLLAGAVLTKNEAFPAAVILCGLAAVRHRERLRETWTVAIAIAVGVAWHLLARLLGAKSDLLEGGNAGKALHGDRVVWERVGPTVVRLTEALGWLTAAVILISVLGGFVTLARRRRLGIGSDLWCWSLLAGNLGVLTATYVVSPYGLEWHLNSSIDRTTVEPGMLLLAIAAVNLLLALEGRSVRQDPQAVARASPATGTG